MVRVSGKRGGVIPRVRGGVALNRVTIASGNAGLGLAVVGELYHKEIGGAAPAPNL